MRSVTILGATGSVGRSTLDLILRDREAFSVEAVTANSSAAELAAIAIEAGAKLAVVADETCYAELREALAGSGVEAAAGREAVVAAAARPADFVMAAIVGAAGLPPVFEAAKRGAIIGLANKEALVCAGGLLTQAARHHGAELLPVDSEHNAIFQVLDRDNLAQVEKLVLTASGGPFRTASREKMASVTPEQAVDHPNWSMGAKISVDSATMMNKGLEFIEAYHLFGLPTEQIEIVVHPQSIVHSLVSYRDGSTLAQLGMPDMRTPIAVCLAWPGRMAAPVNRLDLAKAGALTFEAPDETRFPSIRLARQALASGTGGPVVLNAANEVAVAAFLAGKLGFLDIAGVAEEALARLAQASPGDLEGVLALDRESRAKAGEIVGDAAA